MQGLTPEQIQEGKRLIIDAQLDAVSQTLLTNYLWRHKDSLLAAAESVGKLEQQLAAKFIEPDGLKAMALADEWVASENAHTKPAQEPRDVLRWAYQHSVRSGGVAYLLNGVMSLIAESNRLRAQLTAREQENAAAYSELGPEFQAADLFEGIMAAMNALGEARRGQEAAEAEVERLQAAIHVAAAAAEDLFGIVQTKLKTALAPSHPPQTTETRG